MRSLCLGPAGRAIGSQVFSMTFSNDLWLALTSRMQQKWFVVSEPRPQEALYTFICSFGTTIWKSTGCLLDNKTCGQVLYHPSPPETELCSWSVVEHKCVSESSWDWENHSGNHSLNCWPLYYWEKYVYCFMLPYSEIACYLAQVKWNIHDIILVEKINLYLVKNNQLENRKNKPVLIHMLFQWYKDQITRNTVL